MLLQSLDTSSALNDKNPAFTRLPLNRTKIMYSPYFDISQPWNQRSTYYRSLLCKLYKKNQFHVVSWSFDPLNAQGLYKLALLELANRVFNSLLKKVSKNHFFMVFDHVRTFCSFHYQCSLQCNNGTNSRVKYKRSFFKSALQGNHISIIFC